MENKKRFFKRLKHVSFALFIFETFAVISLSQSQVPGQAKKNLKLGNKYFHSRNYKKAIEFYKKAFESDTKLSEAAYNIGVSYQYLGSSWESHAKTWYKKAVGSNPKLSSAYHNLGVMAYNENDYAEAVSYFMKASRLSPKDKEIQRNLRLARDSLEKEKQEGKEKQDLVKKEEKQKEEKKKEEVKTKKPPVLDAQEKFTPETKTKISPEKKVKEEKFKKPKPKSVEKIKKKKTVDKVEKKEETAKKKLEEQPVVPAPEETKPESQKPLPVPVLSEGLNRLVLCAGVKNREPENPKSEFNSKDGKVTVFMDLSLRAGSHRIEVVWVKPDGQMHGKDKYSVTIPGRRYRTWCWRRLSGLLRGKNYQGVWKVTVSADGKTLGETTFTLK